MEPVDPSSRAPERRSRIATVDGELALYEWGPSDGRPIVLVHGFLDHGRGFDRMAPHLAERHRVVAFDARGHGDSTRADHYGWEADVQDLARVIDSVGGLADVIGHSRGAGIAMDAAVAYPERIRKLVNIDGFGPPLEGWSTAEGVREAPPAVERLVGYLDRRRSTAANGGRGWRPYPSFDALVERRASQNPRLEREWLRYFVHHAALETPEGWVWKADPLCTLGAGPWEPGWIAPTWRFIRTPLLAMTGTEEDAWGPAPEAQIEERLGPIEYQRALVHDTGHFVHMEKPAETARLALDWLSE